jgi:hypothetical protein
MPASNKSQKYDSLENTAGSFVFIYYSNTYKYFNGDYRFWHDNGISTGNNETRGPPQEPARRRHGHAAEISEYH